MAGRRSQYPETKRVPVVQTIGGMTFEDPYQWLEEENEEVRLWQAEQTRLAEQAIQSFPYFQWIKGLVEQLNSGSNVVPPRPGGGRWFREILTEDARQVVLVVSDEPFGEGKVLIDPNQLSVEHGSLVSLDWWYLSPDGRHVACGLSESDRDVCLIHVIETETGKLLSERLPGAVQVYPTETSGAVAWLKDGSGFFYAGVRPPDTARHIWFHRLGYKPPTAPEAVDVELEFPTLGVSDDGRWAFAITTQSGTTDFRPGFLCDLTAAKREWRPFLRDVQALILGEFVGERYVAVTTYAAPRGRVVSIPISTGSDPSTWEELIPEGDAVINGIGLTKSGLVVSEFVQTRPRVRLFDLDGVLVGEMPLPGQGAVTIGTYGHTRNAIPGNALVRSSSESDELIFTYSAPDQSPSIYRYRIATEELEQLTRPVHSLKRCTVRQLFASSTGDALVPATVVQRSDFDEGVPRPTLIFGYGFGGHRWLAGYSPLWSAWIQAGGVFVLAHPRGDGILGDDWRQDGRRENKQHTFEDIYAIAEKLIADGVTTRELLTVMGGSGGGVLAGAAVTQRPELWGAVVIFVPPCDFIRGLIDTPANWVLRKACLVEQGDPESPEEARWLYAYSPYHNVRDGEQYPATLLSAGAHDVRCLPWHARKMAARLQHATSGDAPILLHVEEAAGHGSGQAADTSIKIDALKLAFIMHAVGMVPESPTPRLS